MWITLSIIILIVVGIIIFLNGAQFGSVPKGERAEKIKQSIHYKDGKFQNLSYTPQLTSNKGYVGAMIDFLFGKKERLRPTGKIPTVKTDLLHLDPTENMLVWFGHSSYFIQIDGKKILVDPVFSEAASPVSFYNNAFEGTNIYSPQDMPTIDYLFISHDHWDHLDYPTVKALKATTKKIICGIGVGEHFERWGFDPENIIETDWDEQVELEPGFRIFCLPARHFSGRGLQPNQSLWASFLLQTPSSKIYIGGDSGYDTHFKAIGERFEEIDLAILENGQYGTGWKYIHMMPEEVVQAAKDLNAKKLLPVHHSKYALAAHPWDEPMRRITEAHKGEDLILMTPIIGEKTNLDTIQTFNHWWENVD